MSLIDNIKKGTRLTAELLYDLVSGLANGDLDTYNNNLSIWRDKTLPDFVVEGLQITADSPGVNRNASTAAGIIMIGGQVIQVASVASRNYSASKDTYVDIDNTGTYYYTEVSNNAASPALSAGRIRVGIVVTGATTIAAQTSINQGEPARTVPSTCNLGRSGIDSLGNKICRRDPYAPIIFHANTNLGGSGDVSSLTLPLLQDSRLVIDGQLSTECVNTPSCAMYSRLYVDGTNVDEKRIDTDVTSKVWATFPHSYIGTVSAGSRIVKLNLTLGGGGYYQYTCTALKIMVYAA